MTRMPLGLRLSSRTIACVVCGLLVYSAISEAGPRAKRAITKPRFDPSAERIGLFEGIEANVLSAQLVSKDETQGHVFIENLTDRPITVELPEAVVGVQVLAQAAAGGFGEDTFDTGTGTGAGDSGGQAQATGGGFGGGFGGMGGFGGGFGGMGGGFYSIPAESTVRVPYHSVCLEHGKREPHPRMKYKLIRPEEYTDNRDVHELLKLVGTGKVNKQAAQAAAWHLASEMSWQELIQKKYDRVRAEDTPYFTPAQLMGAQELVGLARQRAAASAEQKSKPQEQPEVRGRNRLAAP